MSPVRRYWQAFRVNSSARLTEVGDALEYEWPAFLAWTAGGAVALVGAIRLLQAWSLESSSTVRGWPEHPRVRPPTGVARSLGRAGRDSSAVAEARVDRFGSARARQMIPAAGAALERTRQLFDPAT